jgi:enamine deaminase RidA (YjgF/YER057c/UK114 family)
MALCYSDSMFKIFLALQCTLLGLSAQAIQHINPEGLSQSPAYSQVVTATPGKVIWLAGQVGQNAKGELVGKGDLKAQLNQAWQNVKTALAASGATFGDVVKITTYVKNYTPAMRNDLRETRLRFMGTSQPPAATLVGVQSLASEDFLVEIEATAVLK